jgi:hypothetical protein
VRLRLKVQIPVLLRHDVRALQTQEQRLEAHHRHRCAGIVRLVVRLRYYARFLVDIGKDRSVVLEGLFARVFKHFAHVLYGHVSSLLILKFGG